jgi:hypothetical protein
VPPIPFPQRVQKNKKKSVEEDKEILDTFRKVAVNIPLLDAIKQIPKYAKFLKDLCTNRRKVRVNENDRVSLGRNVSAFIHSSSSANVSTLSQTLPRKCKDPGVFAIPCSIGDKKFENCMLDLGASINVMPTSIYNNLNLGPLQPTGLIVQLANRSNVRPAGVLEDVLVQVNDLIFPADFYILDMEGETNSSRAPIILGRPFMRTAKTKVDVYDGTMSMEFGDIVVKFNIFDAMKQPVEEHSVFGVDVLDNLVEEEYSAQFPSIYGFNDTCQNCTDETICSMCAEIFESHISTNNTDTDNINCTFDNITVASIDIVAGSSPMPHPSTFGAKPLILDALKKEKTKHLHDKMVFRKEFHVGQKVLLFNPCPKVVAGKPRPKWIGPFIVTNVFPHGAVELKNAGTKKLFKVNRKRLKLFHENLTPGEEPVEELSLDEPSYTPAATP